jgi:hypothetical protein
MAVSQYFLNNFDELVCTSDSPCKCEEVGQQCRGCVAREEIESLNYQMERIVERLKSIPEE